MVATPAKTGPTSPGNINAPIFQSPDSAVAHRIPNDLQTKFEIGSTTKQFTALLGMRFRCSSAF
jgi:hypothetical protein